MDSTLAGLLQGCAETPYDGTPHRILADWLDDHDQPERAELVRLQCQLADWVPDWRERQALIQRQDQLIAEHAERWLGPLRDLCEQVQFVRGLAHIWVSGLTFARKRFGAAYADQRETALIEKVHFVQTRSLRLISRQPWVGFAPALSLVGMDLTDEAHTALLGSDHLRSVVALDLSGTGMNAEALDLLLETTWFPRLARLGLRHNRFTPDELQKALDAAPATLLDLDLANNTMDRAILARLASLSFPDRLVNSLGMEFVRVPAGSFLMGASSQDRNVEQNQLPQHEVTLTRPCWMGRFAVTQEVYAHIMGINPADHQGPTLPVEFVNYQETQDFCSRLSNLPAERAARRSYRLPTEAEWEHGCRAGTFTAYHFGEEPLRILFNSQPGFSPANYEQDYQGETTSVGSFPPNAFGLYDMHGNIWEWTSDHFANYRETPSVDPQVEEMVNEMDERRSIRGGCFTAVTAYCRSFHRYGEGVARRDRYTGFRVVMEQA